MLALVLHTAYVLWCRPHQPALKRSEKPFLFRALCLFVLAATSGLLLTDRSQAVHSFFRGCVTYAFSAAFLYIFVAQAAAAADLDKRFPSRSAGVFSSIFSKGFGCFMVAIFGWIVENIGCAALQHLPFGLPFPHFHGLLWHLGCAAGDARFCSHNRLSPCLISMRRLELSSPHRHRVRQRRSAKSGSCCQSRWLCA